VEATGPNMPHLFSSRRLQLYLARLVLNPIAHAVKTLNINLGNGCLSGNVFSFLYYSY